MSPTLALLVTYHNERDLLRECLASFVSSHDTPDEIIVYDDASDAPANEYVPPSVNARVIRATATGGPARGRNALLRATRADYIHFHDADDFVLPEWCSRVRTAIADGGPDVVFTEVSSVQNGAVLSERVLEIDRLVTADADLVSFCLRGSMLVPAGTYRRSVVEAVGGYRETLWQSEDFDFHVRLAASGVSFSILPDPLVVIRVRPESRSQNRLEVWTSIVDAVAALARELPASYRPELAEAAARAGSQLYKLKARQRAREAFALASRLGPPVFDGQSSYYRWVARTFTPEVAEELGLLYRALLPGAVRARARQLT